MRHPRFSLSVLASMKALPKRKGNIGYRLDPMCKLCLNESPSQKEGKLGSWSRSRAAPYCLNESPSQKEGK